MYLHQASDRETGKCRFQFPSTGYAERVANGYNVAEGFFLRPNSSADVTTLLRAWRAGDEAALNRLTPLVYAELRRFARRQLQKEREAQTLQPTALVHEAYIRLVDAGSVDWKDRAHFFALSTLR